MEQNKLIKEFLIEGIERKMSVILQCKLATHNKQMSKTVMFQFVPNFLTYVFAKYYLTGLQLGKLSQK